MAVNELTVTVVGWVGSDPVRYLGDDGQVPFTKFRLASTPRVYDRDQDGYVDADTSWFTVKTFRHLALNVADAVRRGEPVVVHGRLRLVDWVAPDGRPRTTAELTADAVGHDLSRGTTRFTRTVHATRGSDGPGGPGDAAGPGGADGPDRAGEDRDGHRGDGRASDPDGELVPVDVSQAVELPDDDPLGDELAPAERLTA
ncbi:single-stranded DNA-binding protein [Cellulomonas sp. PS-H5]|uniref:single-stranded DNA-binding protein n=1 Tax=Cellulomonas sp. PS-H5 TaxID=2820400 RepID=UPI001C4E71C8|nr:single-stranded DNA-binding protein [Cellulomonas sp. PS-H5]MBW0253641.1 single-stranded DNA-binding protein [Cellulomonas sp. PS-H5]